MNVHRAERGHDVLDIVNAICLTTGNLWRREQGSRKLTILSLDGEIWITEEGNRNDYILRPGESLSFGDGGLIVAEPLTPFACMRLYEGEEPVPQNGAQAPASEAPPVGIAA